jgi:hypothetical protein
MRLEFITNDDDNDDKLKGRLSTSFGVKFSINKIPQFFCGEGDCCCCGFGIDNIFFTSFLLAKDLLLCELDKAEANNMGPPSSFSFFFSSFS